MVWVRRRAACVYGTGWGESRLWVERAWRNPDLTQILIPTGGLGSGSFHSWKTGVTALWAGCLNEGRPAHLSPSPIPPLAHSIPHALSTLSPPDQAPAKWTGRAQGHTRVRDRIDPVELYRTRCNGLPAPRCSLPEGWWGPPGTGCVLPPIPAGSSGQSGLRQDSPWPPSMQASICGPAWAPSVPPGQLQS